VRRRLDARRRRLTALVADRMQPWVEAGAQRIAGPLARLDPEHRATELEGRLEAVRGRLEVLAGAGRARRGERAVRGALAGELEAVQAELTRLAPRLPAVRVRTLQVRLDGYRQAVEALPEGGRGTRPGQEAGVMAGTAALGWAVLQSGTGGPVTAGAGLVAAGGVATVVTMRNRLRRRDRKAAINEAISAAEQGVPRLADHPVADLSRMLRQLVRRARSSGRLSVGAAALLGRIAERLDALLERSLTEDLDQEVVHLVRASITDYLPDTLDPFLALPDPEARIGDRRASDEVTDQLTALDRALAAASDRTGRDRAADQLLVQGEFLRTKFGPSSAGDTVQPG
jgi:hypothetical protein